VKIRGYRVEPGETEAMLKGHEWVREAAVVVREDEGGGVERRMVAYVVVDEAAWERLGAELGVRTGRGPRGRFGRRLRGYLRERLPEQMAPTN
jgi:acyl-coenzyme A synthetase/AMP-(fatty) acid ligase